MYGTASEARIDSSQSDTWASPAFLKQNKPSRSSYDPFAEDSADFLDGGREKRFKFGRGISQWRFAERTPSPEKEDHATVDDAESPLPTASSGSQAQELPTQMEPDPTIIERADNALDGDIPEAKGISETQTSLLESEASEDSKRNVEPVESIANEPAGGISQDVLTKADDGASQPDISHPPDSPKDQGSVSSGGSPLSVKRTEEAIDFGPEPSESVHDQEHLGFGLDGSASSRPAIGSQAEDFDRVQASWEALHNQATEPNIPSKEHSPEQFHATVAPGSPEKPHASTDEGPPEQLHASVDEGPLEQLQASADEGFPDKFYASADEDPLEQFNASADEDPLEQLQASANEDELEQPYVSAKEGLPEQLHASVGEDTLEQSHASAVGPSEQLRATIASDSLEQVYNTAGMGSPEKLRTNTVPGSPEQLHAAVAPGSLEQVHASADEGPPEQSHATLLPGSPERLYTLADGGSPEELHISKEEDPWLGRSSSAQGTASPDSSHGNMAGNGYLQPSEKPTTVELFSEKNSVRPIDPLLSEPVQDQNQSMPNAVTPDRGKVIQQISDEPEIPGQEEASISGRSAEHTRSNLYPPETKSPRPTEKSRQQESPVSDAAEKVNKAPTRSQVEVIDLESDEEEANAELSFDYLPQQMPDSLQTVLGSDEPVKPAPPIQDTADEVEIDDHRSSGSSARPIAELESQKREASDKSSSSNIDSTPETFPPAPSDSIKLAELADVSDASPQLAESQERLLSAPASPPLLPATIGDSIEQVGVADISIIYEEQEVDTDSQPSTVTSRSVEDEHEEMIPHLTQETSAGVFLPEISAKAIDLPPEDQEMEAVQPEIGQLDENVRNPSQECERERPDLVDDGEDHPREVDANNSSISKQVPQETPLVRRLRQQRRLSRLQQQDLSDTPNTASPWFARPQPEQSRLSKNDGHLTSPDLSHSLKSASSVDASPEMSLPKASAQTSPLQSSPPRTPTSSQYLPASQPAAGFRTTLAYFVPLASLQHHYGTEVDVLAIVVETTAIVKAESGPRDYVLSLHVVDPSSLLQMNLRSGSLTTAQCFRPRKMSLPRAKPGDAILLRNFKVHSLSKRLALISTDASGWAVFGKDKEVQVRGPPVEFGPEERGFARAHWNWWDSLSKEEKESLFAAASPRDSSVQSSSHGDIGSSRKKGIGFDLPPSSSARKAKIREYGDSDTSPSKPKNSRGTKHENTPDLTKSPVQLAPEREISETPSPQQRQLRSRQSKGVVASSLSPEKKSRRSDVRKTAVHELRDGTRYVDEGQLLNENEENLLSPDTQIQVHRLRDGTTYPDRK